MMRNEKTKLELLLLFLLIAQVIVFILSILGKEFSVNLYGPSIVALIIISIAAAVYLYLIYGLLKPTLRVLMIGAIFCAIGIIHVDWPNGMWGWSLGLTIEFKLFELDKAVVSMNITNFILCILFLKAHRNRKALFIQI